MSGTNNTGKNNGDCRTSFKLIQLTYIFPSGNKNEVKVLKLPQVGDFYTPMFVIEFITKITKYKYIINLKKSNLKMKEMMHVFQRI